MGHFVVEWIQKQTTKSTAVLNVKMKESIVTTTNVANITDCILELVSNSLNANATSIAIRIHSGERKIQIIDNGIGIPKIRLKTIAEYNSQNFNCLNIHDICNARKQTLVNIRRLSNAMIVASRYYNSSKTYTKVFKVCHDPRIVETERRPSQGTTVSIYGFHELCLSKWNTASVYYLIGNIAIANPQTSFTIRDDQQKKVTMIVTKPHNSIDLFKLLYDKEALLHKIWYIKSTKKSNIKFCAYIGLSNIKSTATQYIFLNNKLVHCPFILQIVSTIFIDSLKFIKKEQDQRIPKRETVFILLFVMCTDYTFTIEKGKRTSIFSNIQDLLQIIRNKILKIFARNMTPLSASVSRYNRGPNNRFESNKTLLIADLAQLFTPVSQNNTNKKENIDLTLSEWSNWSNSMSLKQYANNSPQFYKRFDFLPEKLHKLLRGNTKLVKTDILNECNGSICSTKLKSGLQIPDLLPHEEINVRLCKTIRRYREFKLDKELLKIVKILGQMNNELIVGLIIKNDMKMLLLIDQHAVHERIRYEQLLHEYKSQMKDQLFSIKLKNPIFIQLSVDSCNLLLSNQMILKKLGISLNTTSNNDTVLVHAVPECLRKNKYRYDELKLKLNIKTLLNELLQSFTSYGYYEINSLPFTIHNAIAMEACHGAIKFGDPLTLRECKWLLKLLYETKSPTRCAHGRPSIIPLLELTNLKKRHRKIVREKLNFKGLKLYRARGYKN